MLLYYVIRSFKLRNMTILNNNTAARLIPSNK